MNNYIEQIRELLPKEEVLLQLGEEATELAKAALKLRRIDDGTNPTPVKCGEAVDNLHEEIADVWTVLLVLGIEPHYNSGIYDVMNKKTERWVRRLAERVE